MSIKVGDTVWLTRYALSSRKIETGEVHYIRGNRVYPVGKSWSGYTLGTDCAATEAEAIVLADAARLKKIASLRKSIAKLETLKFGAAS